MTTTAISCAAPVPFERLVALWVGDLPADDAEALEQHLFSCDVCAEASDRLGKLITGVRALIPPVISHAHRDRLMAGGMRIRQTPVDPGVDADAHFTHDVDLLLHVLKGDLDEAEQVDVELLDPQGVPRINFAHVPFDRGRGEILIACQRHYQTDAILTADPRFRVHAIAGGVRREVGSYFVRHHWY